MVRAINSRTFRLGGGAVLLAAAFTGALLVFEPAALWDWLITLAATFISVVFAVALFWYQREKNDQERQDQLFISLAEEAHACLRMLEEPLVQVAALNNEKLGTAVLVPLPTTVIDEAIRSGLHYPSDTHAMILIASQLHAHNSDVQAVVNLQAVKVDVKIIGSMIERLNQRQEQVARNCQGLIDKIEALSIPEPGVRRGEGSRAGTPQSLWKRLFGA